VAGIFCNLAKVFYCVDHEVWLAKAHFYGIQGTDVNWFRSYVTDERKKLKQSHRHPVMPVIFSQTEEQ